MMLTAASGFLSTPPADFSHKTETTGVSILISARNEAVHIAACLNSLLQQDYDRDKIQILVCDDASTDNTFRICEHILQKSAVDFTLVRNSEQLGKKRSLTRLISLAKHDLLVTRDADTYSESKKWLAYFCRNAQTEAPQMLIGPVALSDGQGLLWALQCIENNVLTILSAGAAFFKVPFLCSGANLGFNKSAFLLTEGYSHHLHIASGDDVLFLNDLKKHRNAGIVFLRSADAVVRTYPMKTIAALFSQKIRWAAKLKTEPNLPGVLSALLVLLVNSLFICCLADLFLSPPHRQIDAAFLVSKLCIDLLLLILSGSMIKNRHLWWYIVPVALLYPLYSVLVAIGSATIKPDWKK
jgi:cellulose synthase/poly-beta-1,6-N-acetylglucosamine synthase-like glycosyltransferase